MVFLPSSYWLERSLLLVFLCQPPLKLVSEFSLRFTIEQTLTKAWKQGFLFASMEKKKNILESIFEET